MGDDITHEVIDGHRIPDIAGNEPTGAVTGSATTDHDLVTRVDKGLGDAPAQAAGASGDEDDAAQRRTTMSSAASQPNAIAGVMQAPGPG